MARRICYSVALVATCVAEDCVRVACLGDSITEGKAKGVNKERDSYPPQTQDRLGDGWCVFNYGNGGKTVGAAAPFRNTGSYEDALAAGPHAIIITLGTNDCQFEKGAPYVVSEFLDAYKSMMDDVMATSPTIEAVLFGLPPPLRGESGKWDQELIRGPLQEDVRAVVAWFSDEYGDDIYVGIVDFFEAFGGGGAPVEEYYADIVHPSEAGYMAMADVAAAALRAWRGDDDDSTPRPTYRPSSITDRPSSEPPADTAPPTDTSYEPSYQPTRRPTQRPATQHPAPRPTPRPASTTPRPTPRPASTSARPTPRPAAPTPMPTTRPTRRPTPRPASPTPIPAAPTMSPTSPTSNPVAPTPGPVALMPTGPTPRPAAASCEDDASWFYNQPGQNCDYVRKKSARCKSKNANAAGESALDACPETCGTCPTPRPASTSTPRPTRPTPRPAAPTPSPTLNPAAPIAGPTPRPAPACEDDSTWFYSKPGQTCEYVKKKVLRCKSKNVDAAGESALDACPETCGTC